MKTMLCALAALVLTPLAGLSATDAVKPNIVYFVIDELGYYESSHMGHPEFRTPNMDRLAAEGTRFTQFLAGSAVCAPTRCALLTGKHTGHSTVRNNGGFDPLLLGEETIGSVLKRAGYATGGFGKWGNGGRGTSGVPEKHGFDVFFGYYWTPYKDKPWSDDAKIYAAMVSLVDRELGEIRELLKELGIADKTFILFTGDNGGHEYFADKAHPRGLFGPNVNPKTGVEFRGGKGNLFEGGLRVPAIAHWPGRVAAGRVSQHLGYFPDLLPTFAELAGAEIPKDVDGLSLVPELLGEQAAGHKQAQHRYLYWEIGNQTAVRMDDWKAYRKGGEQAAWQLFDLAKDVSETSDVAAQNPAVLAQLKTFATEAHRPMPVGEIYDRALVEKDRKYRDQEAAPKAGKARKQQK
ncbi:MAG: sulfatase-like hydrolase/transferase [Kiritimatiellaeota bacterium]|nr:sulfatase-like hydrolase/transferase [Kiritimatiellota bacterium]